MYEPYTIENDKVWFTMDAFTDPEAEWKWYSIAFMDKYYPNWRVYAGLEAA